MPRGCWMHCYSGFYLQSALTWFIIVASTSDIQHSTAAVITLYFQSPQQSKNLISYKTGISFLFKLYDK